MTDTNNDLVGLWVYTGISGNNACGQIRRAIGTEHWLVEMKYPESPVPSMKIFSTADLALSDENASTFFRFFYTKEDLERWAVWNEGDNGSGIGVFQKDAEAAE
jgi:hypothetical protein